VALLQAALRCRAAPVIWSFHEISNPRWFGSFIDEIASTLRVVPLATLGSERSNQSCAITFDDGLRSVVDVAHPVLSARGLPYTVFVSTDVLAGGPPPWFARVSHLVDRLGLDRVRSCWPIDDRGIRSKWGLITALKELPLDVILGRLDELESVHSISPEPLRALFLTSEDVSGLSRQGVAIGSHTHRHPILSHLSSSEQRREIEDSACVIRDLTGRRPTELAYPNGTRRDFDDRTLEALRASGIELAVTGVQRRVTKRDDPLTLPRISLDPSSSQVRLALKNLAPRVAPSYRRELRLRRSVLARTRRHPA
jgi:peptidoglycan/xylan/chitin deacetylase (PgdA/CDA1 family)